MQEVGDQLLDPQCRRQWPHSTSPAASRQHGERLHVGQPHTTSDPSQSSVPVWTPSGVVGYRCSYQIIHLAVLHTCSF